MCGEHKTQPNPAGSAKVPAEFSACGHMKNTKPRFLFVFLAPYMLTQDHTGRGESQTTEHGAPSVSNLFFSSFFPFSLLSFFSSSFYSVNPHLECDPVLQQPNRSHTELLAVALKTCVWMSSINGQPLSN